MLPRVPMRQELVSPEQAWPRRLLLAVVSRALRVSRRAVRWMLLQQEAVLQQDGPLAVLPAPAEPEV